MWSWERGYCDDGVLLEPGRLLDFVGGCLVVFKGLFIGSGFRQEPSPLALCLTCGIADIHKWRDTSREVGADEFGSHDLSD